MTVPAGEIRYLWNGDEIKTGTTAAIADLNALSTAVDSASADINTGLTSVGDTATTQLGSTVPAAADTAAVGLTTKASKFKAVGTELGTELAQGVAGGVDPATSAVNVGSSLSGLLAASATTAGGAAAAVGLGLGVALIKNMIDGAKERRADFVAAVDEAFNAVEVNAGKSLARIRQDIIDAFTIKESIDQLKDLGITVTEIEDLTKGLGVPFTEVVDILRGQINPANRDTLALLREQARETEKLNGLYANGRSVVTDQAKLAERLVSLGKDRSSANQEAYGWAKLEKEAMDGAAAAAERAAAAAERLGFALGNAARQAANIAGLDLGS